MDRRQNQFSPDITGVAGGKKSRFRLGLAVTGFAALIAWGIYGGDFLATVNPALTKFYTGKPTLDAWVMPPEYTGLPPLMIATPAELRHTSKTLNVAQGSVLSVHLAERDGETPTLIVNGTPTDFTADEHGDFEIKQTISATSTIDVTRDNKTLASWNVRVTEDQPPHIALLETPTVTTRDNVKFNYTVKDDYGTVQVAARISPHVAPPEKAASFIEIPLSSLPASPDGVTHISLQDLTANPWSGMPVDVQLVAIDAAGQRAETLVQTVTLPERSFEHPVAKALIEERKKLFQSPGDENVRNEVASLMAGVAERPVAYHSDPVVLMALRSGAVRLVLDRSKDDLRNDILGSVGDLLWQSALRIEYGKTGQAEQNLHHAQKDLSDALDRGASESEVKALLDKLHGALEDYLGALASRAIQPRGNKGAANVPVLRINILDRQELELKLQQLHDDQADNAAARQDLAQFADALEENQIAIHMMTALDDVTDSDGIKLPSHIDAAHENTAHVATRGIISSK